MILMIVLIVIIIMIIVYYFIIFFDVFLVMQICMSSLSSATIQNFWIFCQKLTEIEIWYF